MSGSASLDGGDCLNFSLLSLLPSLLTSNRRMCCGISPHFQDSSIIRRPFSCSHKFIATNLDQ